jgi:hypothetical protein
VSALYIHDDSGGQIDSYLRKYSGVRMSVHAYYLAQMK